MSRVRRWFQLSWRERLLLARAVLHLVTAKYGRSGELRVASAPGHSPRATGNAPELIAWAVLAAARNAPFTTTCLDRALALFRLLRAEGHEAALRIGVRTGEGELAAHAWVEHGGAVLLDEDASRFVAFDAPILITK